jgi:hypothetical protein
MLKELYMWQFEERDFNTMYYAFDLNLAGSDYREFIGKRSFLNLKNRIEAELRAKAGCSSIPYDAITKDKFYANSIFSANGIECLHNLAFIHGNHLIFTGGKQESVEAILYLSGTFFIKNTVLEGGDGVYSCRIVSGKIEVNGEMRTLNSFLDLLGSKVWVVQKQYISHPGIRNFNGSALNTTRIVTILKGSDPEYFCGFQAFATGRAFTDSWKYGSIYVGIDPKKGCLKEYGITAVEDEKPGLLREHPDSKLSFKGYEIPFFKEAKDLCLKAHRLLYFHFVVGWDVAITDEGPLIVEANEKPGMDVAQCLDGGLRKRMEKYAAAQL